MFRSDLKSRLGSKLLYLMRLLFSITAIKQKIDFLNVKILTKFNFTDEFGLLIQLEIFEEILGLSNITMTHQIKII